MCQIRKSIILLTLLFSFHLFAESTVTYEMSQNEQKDRNGYLQDEAPTIKKRVNTLNLSLDDVLPLVSFSGTFRFEQPDYSTYNIRGTTKLGNLDIPDSTKDKKLSETEMNAKEEVWTNVSLTAAKGPWSVTLGGEKNITPSPFSSSSLNTEATYGFYNQSTLLSASASYTKSHKPKNFFTDQTSSMTWLPTTVHKRSYNLGVEQILTDRFKGKLYLGFTDKTEERPESYSSGLRFGMAFNDYVYGKVGYRYAFEPKGGLQKTENGFLNQHLVETEVTFEPIFDLLVSFSYDLFIERDDNPRDRKITRLSADQYGMGLSYAWNHYFSTNARASYMKTNQNQTAFNALGGIECKL